MKTYSAKASEIKREWWVVDAKDMVVGRLAAEVSKLLRGKHKPWYTPNLDCGDHVVVINADDVRFTGKKTADKRYYRHTGYPGGIKETNPKELKLRGKPERIIEKAVERMISRNVLGKEQFGKLRVYAGADHPHESQKPKAFDLASKNRKNKIGAVNG